MIDFPIITKKHFHHPIPVDAMHLFCSPSPEWDWMTSPVYESATSRYYCTNRWIYIRFDNFPCLGIGWEIGPREAHRIDFFNWKRCEKFEQTVVGKWGEGNVGGWRKLDDVTLDIYSSGIVQPWELKRGRIAYQWQDVVRVGRAALVPVVSLQMVSRLPRCEIDTRIERREGGGFKPVPFVFKGGCGFLGCLTDRQSDPEGLCEIARIY